MHKLAGLLELVLAAGLGLLTACGGAPKVTLDRR